MSDTVTIAQDYLDRLSVHVLAHDWAGYRAGVALPFSMITPDRHHVVTDEETLRQGFDVFDGWLKALGVTDLIRLVSQATRLSPGMITTNYITHVMARSRRVVPPFASQSILLADDGGGWRAASIANTLRGQRWPLHELKTTVEPLP